jgi:acyl-CoA synthetase (AMP-forming)/AMP-acid ligase II
LDVDADELRGPVTVPDVLAARAAHAPGSLAVVDGDRRWSYGELDERVRRAAAGLVAAGVAPGDRVAIWAPNSADWIEAMLAVWSAGAVLVPLNTRYRAGEAADLLRRSHTRLLLTVAGFLGRDYAAELASLPGHLPDLARVAVLAGPVDGPAPGGSRGSWAGLVAGGAGREGEIDGRVAALGWASPLDLMFTSGTTGRPKGVPSRHGPAVTAFRTYAETLGIEANDRYLLVNPLFHSFGSKAGVVAALTAGASVYPVATFDPEAVAQLVAAEHITVLPGPPALYHGLLGLAPDRRAQLRSLRLAVTGAAAVPVVLLERMADELGFDVVLTAYGLTECGGLVTMCRAGDPPEVVSATSGRAIPGVEVAVAGPAGVTTEAGTEGEVLVRGYVVMEGYLDDPEATAEAIDADGWLHTGDVGVLDSTGGLRITDRLKDMFIVGGFNVYPAEVEAALARHPAVGQVAVVGVPDERLGEVGHAFVVPRAGASPDTAELEAWSRRELANFKVPRRFTVVDALPSNASGKVLKDELRGVAGPAPERGRSVPA